MRAYRCGNQEKICGGPVYYVKGLRMVLVQVFNGSKTKAAYNHQEDEEKENEEKKRKKKEKREDIKMYLAEKFSSPHLRNPSQNLTQNKPQIVGAQTRAFYFILFYVFHCIIADYNRGFLYLKTKITKEIRNFLKQIPKLKGLLLVNFLK